MKEEGGSTVTELSICNYRKPNIVQMSKTEKNYDRRFWDYEEPNLYKNKSKKM